MVAVDMLILHALIVIILIPYEKSFQEVVRTDVFGITWDHAQDACKPHGLENRVDYLRESGIPNEQEFWIGKAIYIVPTRWIEIIGCFQIAENHIQSFPAVASIGYCKTKCYSENMGSYFGYRQLVRDTQTHNCACLPNGIDQKQQRDIQYCLNSTHFFVYRDYNGTVSKSSDPGNCTTVCCGNCNRITTNGNNLEGRRCSSVNSTIVGRCGSRQNSAFTGFKWGEDYYDSLDYCMTRNALLPSSNYCQKIEANSDFNGQISWTNVFREEIEIFKLKDTTIDTEIKTQSPLYTFNKSKDENVNTSPDPLFSHGNSKISFQSTASLFSTKTVSRNGQREKGNKSLFTGAVIGGIIGACSILAVLAVLIVCKIRSKGIFKESYTYQKGETNKLHFSKTIDQNLTYTSNGKNTQSTSRKINDICETGTSGYSVVNNLNKPENINEIYTDAADEEYDILHDKQNRRMCPTENVYQSHGAHKNEDGLTYDSADFGKGNCNDGNGLYDTSCSVVEGDYSCMSYKNHDINITTDTCIYDKST
ncbi:unnamed protein product [Mytilus coruscus]|uniref:WSC domain-containing protein n=1 Tax=Mytilus coruscus TaxID=42192 RepID=A0A6J8ESK1_MYTCO|nr:unnamed protein product [Mytilus coruscus]